MAFGRLKKQEKIKLPLKQCVFNSTQMIDTVLWIDALVSGRYVKHPDNFTYADLGDSSYTTSFLAQSYSDATFYHRHLQYADCTKNFLNLPDNGMSQRLQYIYQGNALSFANLDERSKIVGFIQDSLAPGGYAILPYEATTGWAEYQVVLDLLKEITFRMTDPITSEWLDRVFYELSVLSLKKITALKDKAFIDKLLAYLKSLDASHLEKILKGADFHTFYPSQIRQALNKDNPGAFRFVGTLPIARNYIKLGLDQDQKAFLGDTSDMLMASQRYDLMMMPFQRVDIWQRNYDETANIQTGTTADFYFGCVSNFDQFASKVQKGHATLNFTDAIFTEMRKCLNNGFMTIHEIVQHIQHRVRAPQEVVDRLMLLVMGDQVRFTLKKPHFLDVAANIKPTKLKFKDTHNQRMFSEIRRFFHESGIVIEPNSGLMIPFDQKTSMVIAALTKVHESMVPHYCAEIWMDYKQNSVDISRVQKEFKSILIFFKRHYFGKFLELGLVDQVLVD
ncbi:hypothetical protein [Candidatus Bodocaedibacter vickermanii]|uniref:tRNA (Guanine-N(7)-)-methyltransferase n=1 Tax=Candidatus Bodocaedibacter vickermanii TaxID=2741701 RepID=A0A7L9RSL7_9PROT|nr:tRNA (guanine-N(7)-)-methyltransferase [Candidatus Paracaedibacteraceae bacterium 'Lake Konstanz']